MKPKLLIDCDPGHEDAVAILYAALRSIEPRRPPNAEMAVAVDVQRLIDELVDTMLAYDPPD